MPSAPSPDAAAAQVHGCSCQRLRKLSRLVSQRYDQALAPAGLNVNQFAILRRAQAAPRSISALAAELGMDRSTLSRDLKPLAAAGWVRLRADRDDGRQRRVELTAGGRRAIERAAPLWVATQASLESTVGVDDVGRLHAILDLATERLAP
ncbi:MAG TPA: MarR family transcriptional regulator [Luteimonas sp.]|nr:MarR family transcriptional regulator [Luteimonas sp.]